CLAGQEIPEDKNGNETRQEDKNARNDTTVGAAQSAMGHQLLCGHPLEMSQNHEQKSDKEQRSESDRQLIGFRYVTLRRGIGNIDLERCALAAQYRNESRYDAEHFGQPVDGRP